MEHICPIDASYSHQVSALLNPPSPPQVQKYYEELIKTRQSCGLEVRTNGEYGKDPIKILYNIRSLCQDGLQKGDLVLKDPMLFGIQHSSNKMDCLVCSHCFQFIGSVELQTGRKLFLRELVDLLKSNSGKREFLSALKDCSDHCDLSQGQDDSDIEEEYGMDQCGSSNSKNDSFGLPKYAIDSLMNGELKLPYSNVFSLPSVVSCPGGCKEAFYCSQLCAEADWNLYHSLLCTGKGSKSLRTEALSEFIQHANGNSRTACYILFRQHLNASFSPFIIFVFPSFQKQNIFLLAAKVISFSVMRYRKLKTGHFEEKEKFGTPSLLGNCNFSLLLEAWEPVSMGYKRRWWDCISLPDDVDCHDEAAFRLQIKELAFTSLQLLKAAMFDKECEPLFSLEIYGHIIGMFELNNLDLVVESTVENSFLYIDDLPHPEKEEAEQVTQPFLDALGDDYSNCCEGTAFFPLQSCMNHSCNPNAKAFKREEDRDGQATLVALQQIHKGEEVTISYIDEELPYGERQSLLADYGFRCRCPKSLDEEPNGQEENTSP